MFSYIGVILTKAYIIYVNVHNNNGVEKRDLIFHHNFHKAIAYSWINNTEYRGEINNNHCYNINNNLNKFSIFFSLYSIINNNGLFP